ncbi:hypothetical protein AB0M91_19735 [Micromonospora rifamycinica]|uniref:hypothetical protein n=1 Tax=Micromonospora rifamycinica TaxID=291594 RepID=UPI003425EFFD
MSAPDVDRDPIPPLSPIPGTAGRPGPDVTPTTWPAAAEATTVIVPGLDCGHLPGELCDGACEYWASIARGDGVYELPAVFGAVVPLPPHAPGLVPLQDRALRGAA